jgi:hypothetical protein
MEHKEPLYSDSVNIGDLPASVSSYKGFRSLLKPLYEVTPLGNRKHYNKRRVHRVFLTFSSTMAGMLADGKVQVNY